MSLAQTSVILLAEDGPDDALLFRMALDRAGVRNQLIVLPTSEQALEYLKGEGQFADRRQFPLPRLVFLNLHLPQIGGIGVVKWIRQQPALTGLVVIVITGSTHSPDVARAYQAGANSFIVKPNSLDELTRALKTTMDFWLRVSELPQPPIQPA